MYRYKKKSIISIFLVCTFVFISVFSFTPIHNASGVVQFKKSRVLADNSGQTDLGFQSVLSDSSYVIQNDIIDENFNYWDNAFYYINLVLSNTVQTYFSQTLSIDNYYSPLLSALKTIDDGSMLDRHYFLNAYLVVDENFSAKVYYQLNSETYAFKDCTFTLGSNGVTYDNMNSFVYADYILNSDHSSVLNDYLSTNYNWDGTFFFPFSSSLQNINDRYVSRSLTLSSFVSQLDSSPSKNFYFYSSNSGVTSGTHYVTYLQQISGKYILPLYIDTTIYTHGSFRFSSSYFSHYDSVNFSLFLPDGSNLSLDDFDKEYWRNYKGLESGILWTPQFPTPTPIPTFSLATPSPFPTLIVNATLTPIAFVNNPDILDYNSGDFFGSLQGLLDIFNNSFTENPFFYLFSGIGLAIYSFSPYFKFLLIVPIIALIAMLIGRLRRK